MGPIPGPGLLLLGAAAWAAGAFPDVVGLTRPDQKWTLFIAGGALLLLYFTRRRDDEADPGPFERGYGFDNRTPDDGSPVVGFIGLFAAALALRVVTLGHPTAGDEATFLPFWFGDGVPGLAALLPVAIAGALTPALLYALLRRTTGHGTALLVGATLAVAPGHVILSQAASGAAVAGLLCVASSLVLRAAIALDRAFLWWSYAALLVAAIALGPWATALIVGHAALVVAWSIGVVVAGQPVPAVRAFLAMITVVAAIQALKLFAPMPAGAAGAAPAWIWLAAGVETGAVPTIAWILAALGVIRLLTFRHALAPWLVIAPGLAAVTLAWLVAPFTTLATVPWPALPALATMVGLGLDAVIRMAVRAVTLTAPGRVPESARTQIAVVLAAVVLALGVTPGLTKHFNRTETPAAGRRSTDHGNGHTSETLFALAHDSHSCASAIAIQSNAGD